LKDVVIVGGGIAGLAAAWELRSRDLLVLESETDAGGRLKSLDGSPYWLNLGAHLLPGEGTYIYDLLTALGLESVPVHGSIGAIAYRGQIVEASSVFAFPFVLPLGLRERIAVIRAGIKVLLGVRAYNSAAKRRPGEDDRTRLERLLAFRGETTFAAFLGEPMADCVRDIFGTAIHRVPAEMGDLTAGSGLGIFAEVWSGGTSTIARNVVGGTGRLASALAGVLGERLVTDATVTSVTKSNGSILVSYRHGARTTTARAKHVIVATPAPTAAQIIGDLPDAVAVALSQIAYAPFVALGLRTIETGPMPWDPVYAMLTPRRSFDMFFNQGNTVQRPGHPRLAGGVLLVYAGAGKAAALLAESDERIAATFLNDLYSLYPALRGVVAETVVQRWPLANTFVRPGRHRLQGDLEMPIAEGRIHLAGEYLTEVGSVNQAAETGVDAAARVLADLAQEETRV